MKTMAMILGLLLLAASPAAAERSGLVDGWYVYPSLQYFTWSEFAANGSRLVKESDPLYGAGGAVTLNLYEQQLLLKVKGELFGGDVGYQGVTQSNVDPTLSRLPLKTSSIYFGGQMETDIGWRFPFTSGSFEPFAGVGMRIWQRDIQDSITLDRQGIPVLVGGYNETWYTITTKLGARASFLLADGFRLFVEGGAKYPFLVQNEADLFGTGTVTVKPDAQWSGFAEVGCQYNRFRPSLFYEGYHAGQSPVNKGLLQPRTVSDIFGVNLGFAF
jgi:hypothetical protein